MLARPYEDSDPSGWLMSEKLDGVRALWNGTAFVTRNGNAIHAPAFFLSALPAVSLDGELWVGRGKFQATVATVRKLVADDGEWRRIRFMVFDSPETAGGFEDRLGVATTALAGNRVAQVVPQVVCRSAAHLDDFTDDLLASGAEGVMLRLPGSDYEEGRSWALLKHKPQFTDEAEVVGYETGAGRNVGVVGALICAWNGLRFAVGTGLTDSLRAAPPKVGALITFSHGGLTAGGLPRFPAFVTARDYE